MKVAKTDPTPTTGKHPDLKFPMGKTIPKAPRTPRTPRMIIRPGLLSRKSKMELAVAMKAGLAKTGIALGTQKGLAKTDSNHKNAEGARGFGKRTYARTG